MNFHHTWFSSTILWSANCSLLLILISVAKPALSRIIQHQHATIAALCIMTLCWVLRIQVSDGQIAGMNYHIMGATLSTLMVGPAGALWLGSIMFVLFTLVFSGYPHLSVVGLNIYCTLLPYILTTYFLLILCRRWLPANLFIYIFINGFAAAASSTILAALCIIITLTLAQVFPSEALWHQALPVFIFIGWGEAFLTGLISAVFITLAPHLISTFNDKYYLKQSNQIW